MKDFFSSKLRELRRECAMSQEQLANICGVSVQAVSKWECAQSYPDIELLEIIADTFGVTIDALLRENAQADGARAAAVTPCDESDDMPSDIPDDGVLRVVQYCGRRLLRADDIGELTRELHLDGSVFRIPLLAADAEGVNDGIKAEIKVEIWGDADMVFAYNENVLLGVNAGGDITVKEGDLNGPANAGGDLNCGGAISGPAAAGGDLNCGGAISGPAAAGCDFNCGSSVNGSVTAGSDMTVGGGVSGAVTAGGDLTVGGDVSVGGDLTVGGDMTVSGDMTVEGNASGNVNADGDVTVGGSVTGSVTTSGDLTVNCDVSTDGSVTAGGNMNIGGDVYGSIDAGGDVECGNVDGNVEAGGDVECGDVGGSVDAGGDVECGSVGGNVDAGGDVNND